MSLVRLFPPTRAQETTFTTLAPDPCGVRRRTELLSTFLTRILGFLRKSNMTTGKTPEDEKTRPSHHLPRSHDSFQPAPPKLHPICLHSLHSQLHPTTRHGTGTGTRRFDRKLITIQGANVSSRHCANLPLPF
ncbi:hypothetical protein E2C01_046530 [Portunus trituberculatus]|uniref:Uncharacterized protein n=1 Tax=Portunus trituberculatus TaxID=210409 RepID=A0A5B7G5D4_PORTR|nr:hypothetical protein [Portunus trituberculatus]